MTIQGTFTEQQHFRSIKEMRVARLNLTICSLTIVFCKCYE